MFIACTRAAKSAAFIILFAIGAPAQNNLPASDANAAPKTIRIGIPTMANVSNRSINRRLERDWLVQAFQPDKKKKKNKQPALAQPIEAVALDSDSPAEAAGEARDKNCDYILYTKLVDMREPGDPELAPKPGSISVGKDPLSQYPDSTVMHAPTHYAQVEFRLQKVGDPEPLFDQNISATEPDDENGTVRELLPQIVDRVKSELRQPGNRGLE